MKTIRILLALTACFLALTNDVFGQEPLAEPHRLYLPVVLNGYPPSPRGGLSCCGSQCGDIAKLGASWWANWSTKNRCPDAPGFVPMLWNIAPGKFRALPEGAEHVLVQNEPNYGGQAVAEPEAIAALWPTLEEWVGPDVKIGSPMVAYCSPKNDPACTMGACEWMTRFMTACEGCRIDFIATHWYGDSPHQLEGWLEWNQRWGKPIWLTEWGCTWGPTSQRLACMKKALPIVRRMTRREAWFAMRICPGTPGYEIFGPGALLDCQTGRPTSLGVQYLR